METITVPTNEHEAGETEVSVETQADMPGVAPALAMPVEAELTSEEVTAGAPRLSRRSLLVNGATAALAFGWGLGVGFWAWGRTPPAPASPPIAVLPLTVIPTPQPPTLGLPHNYILPIAYGMLGPQLIKAGAFAYDAFVQVYAKAGQPLTREQQAIVRTGSDRPIEIDHANAYFLLNLLWAAGLANNNPLLRAGPLIANSKGQIERLASIGGWSLAVKPIHELFSGSSLVTLNVAQQARVEEAAATIYRPCCNNPTSFPDCNHGMAMLGLLELMAAQDVDVNTMLETAKMVNSFWFPAQSRELAIYHQTQTGEDFSAMKAQDAVGAERFSGRGITEVRNWLAANGKLEAPDQNGSSCGV